MKFTNRGVWICALSLLLLAASQAFAGTPQPEPKQAASSGLTQISDAQFNRQFSSKIVTANGVKIHYVIGGKGEPLVLLHGWPETWREWRPIMPTLAQHYTVIAVDIRGAGQSERTAGGYDKKTMAADIHALVTQLGYPQINLVGHDIGLMVAYACAAQWPDTVKKLILMDAPLPGTAFFDQISHDPRTWHFAFHTAPEFPEYLTAGREKWYLGHFMKTVAGDKAVITDALVSEITKPYAAPGGMRAGFEWYRAFEQDGRDNKIFFEKKLPMPVLGVSGDALLPDQKESYVATMMRPYAASVQSAIIAKSGHWLTHEQPEALTQALLGFLNQNAEEDKMAAEKAAQNAPESVRETANRAFAAWQKGEHDGVYDDFLALMSAREEFVIYSHPLEKRGVLRGGEGYDALRELIAGRIKNPNQLTFSNAKVYENGGEIAVQFDSNGRTAGSAAPYNGYNAIFFTIKDGKVAGFREYLGYIDPAWFQAK